MTALLALTLLAPAQAADVPLVEGPLPTDGFVVAMPQGDAIGDGATPVTVHVLALRGDGSPLEDLQVKLKSKASKEVSDWSYVGNGIYSFQVVPPLVTTPGPMWVGIKGRTPDKAYAVDLSAKIPLRPRPPLALSLTANPVELVSGERNESTLSFTIADGTDVTPEMLQIRASLGEVGELAAMGGGRYVAKFDVQNVKNPGLALITVSDERRPDRVYGTQVIPIFVKKPVTVKAPSGSSVLLKVDGREYGPIEASKGRAVIPDVLLPPGLTSATQVTVKDGETKTEEIDLGVPPDRRVQIVPTFTGIPGDPAVEVPVRIKVVKADGTPDSSAVLSVTSDLVDVKSVTHEGYGVYMATLSPKVATKATTGDLTVTVNDEAGQVDRLPLTITPVRPTSLTLSADPSPLGEAREATVSARVEGPGGAALTSSVVSLNLTGAKPTGAARTVDGALTQPIQTFGGPVEVLATARTPAAGNHIHQVVLLPSRHWIPGDTISSARLTVVTLDVFGYPVANSPVRLVLESGDGTLPSELTTDENGIGQVFYTAGDEQRVVRIRAEAGRGSAATAILQGDNALERVSVPVSGSADQIAITEAWAKSLGGLRIPVE